MAIYVGSTGVIDLNGSNLRLTANSNVGLTFNGNVMLEPNTPLFIAGGSGTAAYGNQWAVPTFFNRTVVNRGGGWNNSSRFTAPIAGYYWFHIHLYGYKYPSSNNDSYTHPDIWVNGSSTYRKGSPTTSYRLRSRTVYNDTYSWDTRITELIYLAQGEYAEPYTYFGSGTQTVFGYHSMIAGYLVG